MGIQSSVTQSPSMTRLLLPVILSLLLSLSTGFRTHTCTHSKVLDTFASYKICVKNKTAELQTDPCFGFTAIKLCALETFTPCYGDDATLRSSSMMVEVAITLRETFTKLKIPSEDIETFFQTCQEAPTKQETDSYIRKMFPMLDFTETDKKCSREAVEEVQLGLPTCMNEGSVNFDVELKSRVKRARGNLKKTTWEEEVKKIICSTLYDTLGECWREFPTCFTEREISYMKEEMSSGYKSMYDAILEVTDKSHLVTGIDVVECLEKIEE